MCLHHVRISGAIRPAGAVLEEVQGRPAVQRRHPLSAGVDCLRELETRIYSMVHGPVVFIPCAFADTRNDNRMSSAILGVDLLYYVSWSFRIFSMVRGFVYTRTCAARGMALQAPTSRPIPFYPIPQSFFRFIFIHLRATHLSNAEDLFKFLYQNGSVPSYPSIFVPLDFHSLPGDTPLKRGISL